MLELAFRAIDAAPVEHAASPLVALRLEIMTNTPVRAISLRCQAQIDSARRAYDAEETRRLEGVFAPGAHLRGGLRALLWAHVPIAVPAFDERVEVELLLPCSIDLCTERGTYLLAIEEGILPLSLLFSGTVFHSGAGGALQIAPLPMTAEARFALPAATCRRALAAHHGDAALVALPKALVDRLQNYRVRCALPGVGEALAALLDRAEAS